MPFKVGVNSTLKLGPTITQLLEEVDRKKVFNPSIESLHEIISCFAVFKRLFQIPATPLPFWLEISLLWGHSGLQISYSRTFFALGLGRFGQ